MASKYCVFADTETTDLVCSPDRGEILSIGIVIADAATFEAVDKKEWFVKPSHIETASARALQVNGYTPAKWAAAGERPVAEVMREVVPWLRRGTFAGHNCPFDIDFIWITAQQLGLTGMPRKPTGTREFLDTIQFAMLLANDGTVPNLKLDALVEYFGFKRSGFHGALEDADLSRRAAQEIWRRFRLGIDAEKASLEMFKRPHVSMGSIVTGAIEPPKSVSNGAAHADNAPPTSGPVFFDASLVPPADAEAFSTRAPATVGGVPTSSSTPES